MSDQAIDAIAACDATAPLLAPPSTPIIRSLLETDFYKFNMWQLLWRRHPGLHASYRFCCRNTPAYPLAELLPALNTELDALCALRFRPTELAWLAEHSPLRPEFLAWLRGFGFERRHIRAWAEAGQLHIEASGPQPQVMGFEIYVLAIVSELYFRRWLAQQPGGAARALPALLAQGRARLQDKIAQLQALAAQPAPAGAGGFALFDFGLRRRFSAAWQQEVVATLQAQLPGVFKGTSSVLLAQELGLAPIGTMAHEYLQTYQALPGPLRDFQRRAPGGLVGRIRPAPGRGLDGRGGHGRLFGRLWPHPGPALPRPAPRFGRPRGLGRKSPGPTTPAWGWMRAANAWCSRMV